MAEKDFYKILDVERNATEADIKKAYRRLAMKYHPDRNPGDKSAESKFKEAKQAYEVLSNPQKRSAYDQFGHAAVDPSVAGRGASGSGFSGFQDVGNIFGDIFGDIFGGGGQAKSKGADLAYELLITLEEAVRGVAKNIVIPRWAQCGPCRGLGTKEGSKPATCATCDGTGQMRIQHGFIAMQQTCSVCRGQGSIVKDPCTICRGEGRVQERKTLSIKVPAGVETGDRMRLAKEGEAGVNGAPSGDLFVQIKVKEHPIFQRKGNDLYTELPVSLIVATLGSEIQVPTLDGEVRLTVPAETQNGRVFRLRGKGVKSMRGGRGTGDLLCKVTVETPVKLSEEQKSCLKEFDRLLKQDGKDHSPRSRSWLDAVKRFFQ